MNQDFTKRVLNWFGETGQIPDGAAPSVRQTAFYLGMMLEETLETLTAFQLAPPSTLAPLEHLATGLKNGHLDHEVALALADASLAKEALDGGVDLLWVTLGFLKAQGANVEGAADEVASKNEAKRFPDGTYHRHEQTGKVLKPELWQAPVLWPFIHPSLIGTKPVKAADVG